MKLIPVIDLQRGVVVHAIKGERESYQPVKSVLCDSADPLDVARSFRDRLGLSEIYIADLDAILGQGDHRQTITTLAYQEKLTIMLDAGAADPLTIQDLLALGIQKVVIGAETLPNWEALLAICSAIPNERLVFSLDMRSGNVLSRSPHLSALSPLNVLEKLKETCIREVILLDLDRVGAGRGIDYPLISSARRLCPEMELIVGGGVSQANELEKLQSMEISGVLAASALHTGAITKQHIAALDRLTGQ
jgi:phosphoribosylformimino-5-aminoimidazole carboxamide ribotide isomerase